MFPAFRNCSRLASLISIKQRTTTQWKAFFQTYSKKEVLSKQEINVYKKLFDKMDSNKDGFLTKEDLDKGLKDFVNYTASEEELTDTMNTLDTDKDGSVGFEEFINYIAWSRQIRTEEAIRYAFEMFDKNKDGLINKEEIRNALMTLGLIPTDSLLNNIILMSDKDNDGQITLEEFKKVFFDNTIT